MSEVKPEAQPEGAGDVAVEAPKDMTTAQRFTETITEAKAKIAEDQATGNLPAELEGMDQASLEKYYKDGVFNWEAYGKEQAFKAKQQEAKTANEATEDQTENQLEEGISDEENEKIKQATEAAGIDYDAAANSILETGNISDEDRAKLVATGIPEFVIDDYVRLMATDVNARVEQTVEALGGNDMFVKVFESLQEKATEEQRNLIDDMIRDPATFKAGIQLAKDLSGVDVPEPAPNTQITGGRNQAAPTAAEVTGFGSFEEQMAAQRDPRYKNDPAYRDEVMRRISVSTYTVNPRAHTGGL
jgi:hypothetical protein